MNTESSVTHAPKLEGERDRVFETLAVGNDQTRLSPISVNAASPTLDELVYKAIGDAVALRTPDLAAILCNVDHASLEAACWRLYRATLVDNIRGYWCLATAGKNATANRNMSVPDLGPLLQAAMTYALTGIPVFPLQPRTKEPFEGSRGFKDATTDTDVVTRWWTQCPDANIGARCGVAFDVLDVDQKILTDGTVIKDGRPSLHTLNEHGALAGHIGKATTRHGGSHFFYLPSGNKTAHLHDHYLDFQAADSYVVMPPSVVPAEEGVQGPGRYTWSQTLNPNRENSRSFDWTGTYRLLNPQPETAIPGLTKFLNQFSRPRSSNAEALSRWLARQSEGNRNKALFWAACRAVENGFDPEELRTTAEVLGLAAKEITRTINSARSSAGKGNVA